MVSRGKLVQLVKWNGERNLLRERERKASGSIVTGEKNCWTEEKAG